MSSKEKVVRDKILHIYVSNPTLSVSDIARSLKLHKGTVSKVLSRYRETETMDRKPWTP